MKNKTLNNILTLLSSLMLISGCSSKYNYQSEKSDNTDVLEPSEYNQLFAPNSIDFNLENKVLKWASVSGANYYDIKIQGEDSTGKNISTSITNKENTSYTITTANFTKFFETGNKVLISVRAKTSKDKDAIYSNYISYLYDPTNHSDLIQFTYKLDNLNNAIITGFSANCTAADKKNLEIPQSISGHKVIKIGEGAFVSDKKYIESVVIPSTIEEIGAYAFSSVESSNKTSSIKSISFEDNSNLKKIGEGAFYSLSSLNGAFTIPNSVEIIENNAFYSCPNITSIDIDIEKSSLKEIGNSAFYSNTKIESINIPKNVSNIGQYVFQGCTKLKNIYFSSNIQIEEIGAYAFAKTSLSSLVLPSTVKKINEGAFSNCSSLTSFFFKQDSLIEELGDNVFNSCARLRYVSTIKDNGTTISIDDYDLGSYTGNYSISISSVNSKYSFVVNDNKTNAVEITKSTISLPSNIKSIGAGIFSGCKLIQAFKLTNDSKLTYIGNEAFKSCVVLDEFSIPSNLEYVGDDAFNGCKLLNTQNMVFPSTLNYISLSSFKGTINNKLEETLVINDILVNYVGTDTNLTLSTLGNGIKYVSKEVFKKNETLENVDFTGVEKIYDGAFNGCINLKAINLNSSITYIGDDAFNGIKNAILTLDTTNLTYIGNNAFKNVNSEATTKFSTLNIGSNLTYIGESAFEGVNGITSINFEANSTLETIGKKAFYNDSLIQSISFPKSLKVINDEAFSSKSTAKPVLTSISFTNDSLLESIGQKAFSNNVNLSSIITLPVNIEVLEQKVFEKCGSESSGFSLIIQNNSKLHTISKNAFADSGLTNINLTDSITLLEEYAFSGCMKLTSVSFSNDFYKNSDDHTLNSYVFEECESLSSITLPQYITSISDYAFKNSTKLETINSLAEEIDVSNNAFTGTKFANSTSEVVIFNKVLLSVNYVDASGNPKNYNAETETYDYINLDLSSYNITKINDNCFAYNPKNANDYSISKYLKSIILPESLEVISTGAFKNCYYLETITFNGANLEEIKDEAFANCKELKTIELPSSLKYIGNRSFYQCQLENVNIPSNVKEIANEAFAKNGTIKELYIANPDGWEYLTYSIKSLSFESNSKLEKIGNYAFNYNNLETISLPENSISIGNYAFSNSKSLKSITIDSNYVVGSSILYGANNLEELEVAGNISFLGLFGGNSNQVPTLLKKVTIADGSTSIADNSFNGCGNIEQIILPDTIKSIGSYAFFGCRNLKSLNCKNVEIFKEGAFIGCVNLDTIDLSNDIKEIGKNAFMSTGWLNNIDDKFVTIGSFLIRYNGTDKEVTVSDSIDYICGGAFAGNNYVEKITLGNNTIKLFNGAFDSCSNLSTLVIKGDNLCNIELEIFDTLTNFKIYVSDKNLYKEDIYWSLYEDIIYKK